MRRPQFSAVPVGVADAATAATSVPNDCTRGPWGGGVFVGPLVALPATGQVVYWVACVGLGVVVGGAPRPPPTCPTIMIDVGTEFPLAKTRLFVRLIVNPLVAPVGMVITTGDQPGTATGVVVETGKATPAFLFSGAHVANEVGTAAPQL